MSHDRLRFAVGLAQDADHLEVSVPTRTADLAALLSERDALAAVAEAAREHPYDTPRTTQDGPNTHRYRDAGFVTEWTLVHLDDPDGTRHTFHVPSRIVEQIVAVEVAASLSAPSAPPAPEPPAAADEAWEGAVGAMANMLDFIRNGKASLTDEDVANLKTLLELDLSLIGKAFASLRAAAPSDGLQALVDRQAEDEGLWFIAETAPEAYLQQELRKLHEAVEARATEPSHER